MGCSSSRSSNDAVVNRQEEERRNSLTFQQASSSRSFSERRSIPSQDTASLLLPYIAPPRPIFNPNRPRSLPITTLTTTANRRNPFQDPNHSAFEEQWENDLATIERLLRLGMLRALEPMLGLDSVDTDVNNPSSIPPASNRAIQNLPLVRITEKDMEDENNRSCCICFGDHNINDEVARLPCGHFFHHKCVGDWLSKHCTCPICRWELETDNTIFEQGRAERMRTRKMRLKSHDVERLDTNELKNLVGDRLEGDERGSIAENISRSELIQRIEGSNSVDIIS